MFRENDRHLQFGLFDTVEQLPKKVRQRLELPGQARSTVNSSVALTSRLLRCSMWTRRRGPTRPLT